MYDWEKTVYARYNKAVSLKSLIGSFAAAMDAQADFEAMRVAMCDIDTAAGKGLDVIGKWVGMPRTVQVPVASHGPYMGFREAADLDEYGAPQPWGVAPFWGGQRPTQPVELSDDDYRRAIRVKAMANISPNTLLDINKLLVLLFGHRGVVYIRDNQDMTADFVFRFTPTPLDKALVLLVIPKASGVKYGSTHVPLSSSVIAYNSQYLAYNGQLVVYSE
ncbi:MAG: DUF2612 domain-containing protein [Betaproteobacteria bacterium]